MNTRDTAARVCGVPRCVKIHYRTRTRQTRDLKPTGFPVPVTIPNSLWYPPSTLGCVSMIRNVPDLDLLYMMPVY